MASYKGKLTLGNLDKHPESSFAIDVERYPRTMLAKPVSASRYVAGPAESVPEGTEGRITSLLDVGAKLQSVKTARQYQVQDDDEPGEKIDIEREELEKGYKYGRTVVPISQTDENITKLQTNQCMEIIGFIPSQNVCPRSYPTDEPQN